MNKFVTTDDVNEVTRSKQIGLDVCKSESAQRVKTKQLKSDGNLVALACLSIISTMLFS